ncbi:hypothetical protein D3C76_1431430 [compost metagenome]
MEDAANTVTAVFAHHGETFCFNEFLDSRTEGTQANAWLDHLQCQVEAFLGHFTQALAQNGRFADDEHLRGVTVVLVFNDSDVDVNDVAIFQQLFVIRDTVADHFINRDAD